MKKRIKEEATAVHTESMRRLETFSRTTMLLISCAAILLVMSGCGYSRKFTESYYREHEQTLGRIRQNFTALNDAHPFSFELKDRQLTRVGLEIITDTVKYIYTFDLAEHYLVDTLRKYGFDVQLMGDLILDLQRADVTWITRLDYYENQQPKDMLFMAVRHKALEKFLKPEKYFTLAFFEEPQPADDKDRLLDRDGERRVRRFNGDVYRRLRPALFYSISDMYR